jgi:hypothetical protein
MDQSQIISRHIMWFWKRRTRADNDYTARNEAINDSEFVAISEGCLRVVIPNYDECNQVDIASDKTPIIDSHFHEATGKDE